MKKDTKETAAKEMKMRENNTFWIIIISLVAVIAVVYATNSKQRAAQADCNRQISLVTKRLQDSGITDEFQLMNSNVINGIDGSMNGQLTGGFLTGPSGSISGSVQSEKMITLYLKRKDDTISPVTIAQSKLSIVTADCEPTAQFVLALPEFPNIENSAPFTRAFHEKFDPAIAAYKEMATATTGEIAKSKYLKQVIVRMRAKEIKKLTQ
jgi:hypothetical protein